MVEKFDSPRIRQSKFIIEKKSSKKFSVADNLSTALQTNSMLGNFLLLNFSKLFLNVFFS